MTALVATLAVASPSSAVPSAAQATEIREGNTAQMQLGARAPQAQIRRLYIAVYEREPDAGGLEFWTGQLTGGRSLRNIAQQFTEVPEFVSSYGSLNNTQFIDLIYQNVLGRPADSGGRDFWLGRLSQGASRGDVVLGFSESPEMVENTTDLAPFDRLYCAFFLRASDAGGRAFWASEFYAGRAGLIEIATQFATAPEFNERYGSLSNRAFVELIYQNVLGRNLPLTEAGGPTFWTSELARGRTRGTVMVNFSEAPEYLNRFNQPLTSDGCPPAGSANPSASDDSATALHNTPVTIDWAANDSLLDGATLSSFDTTTANGGTVTTAADGRLIYTPANGFSGTDTFTYTIADTDEPTPSTATATVTVTVLAVDDDGVPIANDDVATTSAGVMVEINWAANDVVEPATGPREGSLVDVQSITQPSNGSVNQAADNTFRYTPNAGFVGVDSFTYTLVDPFDGDTSTATVQISVTPNEATNDRALEDNVVTQVNTAITIPVLANDNSAGTTLTLIQTTQPSHGEVVMNADGTVTYTPEADYEAETTQRRFVDDTFTYTIVDAANESSTAIVSVVVTSVPRCEVFMNYPYVPEAGAPDFSRIELFFSNRACFELYPGSPTRTVRWDNVQINGAAPASVTSGAIELREFVTPTAAQLASGEMTITGTAVLLQGTDAAVSLPFQVKWTGSGTTWNRDNSSYLGKSTAANILLNPLS